jgi:hypothetical protein
LKLERDFQEKAAWSGSALQSPGITWQRQISADSEGKFHKNEGLKFSTTVAAFSTSWILKASPSRQLLKHFVGIDNEKKLPWERDVDMLYM